MERSSRRLQRGYIFLFTLIVFVSGNIATYQIGDPFSRAIGTRRLGRDRPNRFRLNCPANKFYCYSDEVCIPGIFHCDNEDDCRFGEDEEGCVYALNQFSKISYSGLSVFNGRLPYAFESYTDISDEMCAKECAGNIICKSFVYGPRSRTCKLSKWNSSDKLCRLRPSEIYDYYELKQDSDCSGMFQCANEKCIEMSSVCDGEDDCRDQSDEQNCGAVTCGKRPYDQMEKGNQFKVAGGNNAQHGAYPWQARVQFRNGTHQCGAVVISEFWLLCAAHCFSWFRKNGFVMVVGDHSKKRKDKGEQTFEVENIIMHEEYNDVTLDNDIALIKIKPTREGHGIKFNSYVQPACLPDSRTPFTEGTKCWISGWGQVTPNRDNGVYSGVLKEAEVPLIGQSQCRRLYASRHLSQRMFCAGYIDGGIDACYGDSGGPLVCKIADAYTVIGITSWGLGCAEANRPGVYARVSAFAPWIDQKLRLYRI